MVGNIDLLNRLGIIIISIILLIAICASGCSTQKVTTVKPPATTVKTYKIGEPATDGNLRLTITSAQRGDRQPGDMEEYSVRYDVVNLRNNQTYTIFPGEDFQLMSLGKKVGLYMFTTNCLGRTQLKLYPGEQYQGELLCYLIPLGARPLNLQFDFSGPNKRTNGGPTVIFEIPY